MGRIKRGFDEASRATAPIASAKILGANPGEQP